MNRLVKFVREVPDAHIDCTLFALIAWIIFSQAELGGDEAAKYIPPLAKFWLNYGIGSAGAICGAVKMFRSTSFAKFKNGGKLPEESKPEDLAPKSPAV